MTLLLLRLSPESRGPHVFSSVRFSQYLPSPFCLVAGPSGVTVRRGLARPVSVVRAVPRYCRACVCPPCAVDSCRVRGAGSPECQRLTRRLLAPVLHRRPDDFSGAATKDGCRAGAHSDLWIRSGVASPPHLCCCDPRPQHASRWVENGGGGGGGGREGGKGGGRDKERGRAGEGEGEGEGMWACRTREMTWPHPSVSHLFPSLTPSLPLPLLKAREKKSKHRGESCARVGATLIVDANAGSSHLSTQLCRNMKRIICL